MPKRVAVGTVMTDKMSKSRRVEIPRVVHHQKYGKIIHRKTVCHIHDENNESHVGDMVEIVECPPKSKLKRWQLVRILRKSTIVDLAAMRAAEKSIDDPSLTSEGNAKADSTAKSEASK
ncbi:MAG: 30S ribosomal protein S17 [Planctomycetia bacterium]|nr:30S ribosomal protein S17 [Planctomycetia bacterium]